MMMAHALRDFICVGVPHRIIRSEASQQILSDFDLEPGKSRHLEPEAALRLQKLLKQAGSADAGPAARLAVQLSMRGSRVGILDLGQQPDTLTFVQYDEAGKARPRTTFRKLPSTASACRFVLTVPDKPAATGISYGNMGMGVVAQSSLIVRSTKILCVEDRLWDVPGGGAFAEWALRLARDSGRSTMLLFSDPDCCFRNRAELKAAAAAHADVLVGEAEAALSCYGLHRLDSLVPQIGRQKKMAILRRATHDPLVFDGTVQSLAPLPVRTHSAHFWGAFLPSCIEEFIKTGRLKPVGSEELRTNKEEASSATH